MASSLQSLFSLPNFQDRYLTSFFTHTPNCTNPNPATCFECQMSKIADGLLSGRYSTPSATPENDSQDSSKQEEDGSRRIRFQDGLKPSMFKNLVGKDHAEFSTMRQQDASEFLFHLLEFIKRSSKKEGTECRDVTEGLFGFELEERLECQSCRGVKYRKQGQEGLSLPVPVRRKAQAPSASDMQVEGQESNKDKEDEFEAVELEECLDNFVEPQQIEYSCSACKTKTTALK